MMRSRIIQKKELPIIWMYAERAWKNQPVNITRIAFRCAGVIFVSYYSYVVIEGRIVKMLTLAYNGQTIDCKYLPK